MSSRFDIEPFPNCCGAHILHNFSIAGGDYSMEELEELISSDEEDGCQIYEGQLLLAITSQGNFLETVDTLKNSGFEPMKEWDNPTGTHCILWGRLA